MDTHIGLAEQTLLLIGNALSDFLANTYALYLKTQNFHWNVTGKEFFSLHLLFEKHYEEMADALDEIAERIRSLGIYVDASFATFRKRSSIADPKENLSSRQMLKELLDGHEALSRMGRPLITEFQKLHDDASSDLLIRRLLFHEKAAWMLRAHLESES